MTKLLCRPKINEDECLVSFLIRVTEVNGFKHVGHLLHHAGLSWKNHRAPIHQILSGEYDLKPLLSTLGLAECSSTIAPIYHSFQRAIDTPYILVKSPRVCLECLEELGYCKYQWALLPIVTCARHKKTLVDVVPASGKTLSWYRQYLSRFDGEDFPIKVKRQLSHSAATQQSMYFEALLSGKHPSSSNPIILQGLDFREALSLIHFIAHYQTRLLGGSFNPLSMGIHDLGNVYENVWQALRSWPDSFYSLLSQYVEQPMSSKGKGGLNKHFRDLYERLYRQQVNEGIARIKAEFDRYIEHYWPGVLEPARISRIELTSTSRNIISKKDAANILGCRFERVDKLVRQGRLKPVIFKGKAHYQRDQVAAYATKISLNWTMAEACEVLEITRFQVKQLLDAGVIPAFQKPDSLNRDWVIDKVKCLALIDKLRSSARKSNPPLDAISMAGVQRQGYSIVHVILAMQSGRLEYGVAAETDGTATLKQFVAFKLNKMV